MPIKVESSSDVVRDPGMPASYSADTFLMQGRNTATTEEVSVVRTMIEHLNSCDPVRDPSKEVWRQVFAGDDPFLKLCRFHHLLSRAVVSLACAENEVVAFHLWRSSIAAVNSINYISWLKPEVLKPMARSSLFLPSFRSKVKKFTNDFHLIQEALELSLDCVVNTNSTALADLDSSATFLVAKLLETIALARNEMKRQESVWKKQNKPGTESKQTFDQWFLETGQADKALLIVWKLPDFNKATADIWWNRAIKPLLSESQALELVQGTLLYDRLCNTAKSLKDYDLIDKLREICRPKVKALAPPAPSDPRPLRGKRMSL